MANNFTCDDSQLRRNVPVTPKASQSIDVIRGTAASRGKKSKYSSVLRNGTSYHSTRFDAGAEYRPRPVVLVTHGRLAPRSWSWRVPAPLYATRYGGCAASVPLR
jgi:hypothetical protein